MAANIYPFTAVLILSYNGKQLLDDSVSSYLANSYQNFEVIVIDNGSVDGTYDYVSQNFPKVKIVRTEKNLGYSGGFNLGLDYAFNQLHADYVLVSNNDVKADPNAIQELINVVVTDEKIGFVTGKVYYYDQPNIFQTVGKCEHPIRWNGDHIGNREEDIGQYDNVEERIFADDVFTLVNGKMYKEIGGYDTTFFLQSEEYEWQARAKKHGYKIMYTPYAKIWHKESMTIGKTSALKAYYDARNPMLVVLLHKSPDFFRRYFWHHFKKGVINSSIKMCLRTRRVNVSLKIWQGFLSGLWWGLKNKKYTRKHFIGL